MKTDASSNVREGCFDVRSSLQNKGNAISQNKTSKGFSRAQHTSMILQALTSGFNSRWPVLPASKMAVTHPSLFIMSELALVSFYVWERQCMQCRSKQTLCQSNYFRCSVVKAPVSHQSLRIILLYHAIRYNLTKCTIVQPAPFLASV